MNNFNRITSTQIADSLEKVIDDVIIPNIPKQALGPIVVALSNYNQTAYKADAVAVRRIIKMFSDAFYAHFGDDIKGGSDE